MPEVLVHHLRETRSLKRSAVFLETVSREDKLPRVRASLELVYRGVHRTHALDLEGPMGAPLVQQVDAWIDLFAHRISHYGKPATLPCLPGGPSDGVESRRPKKRRGEPARKALCRRDAYAHACERPWAAAHQHLVDIRHRKPCLRERLQRSRRQLNVSPATAEVIACGQDVYGCSRSVILRTGCGNTGDGAGQHVSGGVKRKDHTGPWDRGPHGGGGRWGRRTHGYHRSFTGRSRRASVKGQGSRAIAWLV